jgi:transposase
MARDWRDERIDELERENAQLRARLAAAEERIRVLELRIVALEARLAQRSGNSSRPPSSDPPGAPPPALPPHKTGRKRGGQPGHEKHGRALVPPSQVTRTHVLKPDACEHCGNSLTGHDPDPLRHQVFELPKLVAEVDEYQRHSLVCEDCGAVTLAALPPGVPTGQFGPRLQAVVALCTGAYRLSKRTTGEMFKDVFGLPISLGSVANLEQVTSEAITAPVVELAKAILEEPVVHADETGWFEKSKRAWLWGAVGSMAALFLVRLSRGADVAQELLGAAFAGILVSDRWSAYAWVDPTRRQVCWAHLLRQFRGFQAHGPKATEIGHALEILTETMFHAWHRVRDGTETRAEFRKLMGPLSEQVVVWLQDGASCSVEKVAGRCREILKLEPALWTFVDVEGVEPTNNAAERILRQGVLWRKGSFGTDSPSGSRFVERILTVVTTLRLQRRSVLDFLTDACDAALNGRAAPSLLPNRA